MEVKSLQQIDSLMLSGYILMKYGPMSHLKLQKLLFYCDAYHLAYFDTELITDKFEAWVHGPVSRKVFDSLRDKSLIYSDLSFVGDKEEVEKSFIELTSSQRELIEDVLSELSKWSGFQLESAAHKELPWIEARKGKGPADRCIEDISKETTRTFYKAELGMC